MNNLPPLPDLGLVQSPAHYHPIRDPSLIVDQFLSLPQRGLLRQVFPLPELNKQEFTRQVDLISAQLTLRVELTASALDGQVLVYHQGQLIGHLTYERNRLIDLSLTYPNLTYQLDANQDLVITPNYASQHLREIRRQYYQLNRIGQLQGLVKLPSQYRVDSYESYWANYRLSQAYIQPELKADLVVQGHYPVLACPQGHSFGRPELTFNLWGVAVIDYAYYYQEETSRANRRLVWQADQQAGRVKCYLQPLLKNHQIKTIRRGQVNLIAIDQDFSLYQDLPLAELVEGGLYHQGQLLGLLQPDQLTVKYLPCPVVNWSQLGNKRPELEPYLEINRLLLTLAEAGSYLATFPSPSQLQLDLDRYHQAKQALLTSATYQEADLLGQAQLRLAFNLNW